MVLSISPSGFFCGLNGFGVGEGRVIVLALGKCGAQVLSGLTRLRRVCFVDHDRVAALRSLGDLAKHVRELLQRRDDDFRLFADQRVGELGGVLVNLHDDALRVFKLVNRVLQLAV